ncbi:Formyltransferase [Heliocybe sulcata]|uniref:methionyl-tRNA formyltransferase n=1 Tax=Heliocybe sulcata TaxID=5364 RepID=A0A5C3MPN0_9AGAM|nr:Formyltransferase [Heliocybe sulcata]
MFNLLVKCNNARYARSTKVFSQHVRYLQQAASSQPFRILFLGRDNFSCLVLEALHNAKDVWQELAIVTHADEKVGRRGSQLSVAPLRVLAESIDLPVHLIPRTKPLFKYWEPPPPFLDPHPSHLIVTASFGRILSKKHLQYFDPPQRLNVHPSLLPLYRGPAPIQHTLLDNREETGVCVIEMEELRKGIDTGGIWGWERVPVPKGATHDSLLDALGREGGQLLVKVLRDKLAGKAVQVPQESAGLAETVSHAPMITLEDAIIDFSTMSAEDIERRHRAISHQKPLTTYLPTSKTLQLHFPSVYPSEAPLLPPEPGAAVYHAITRSLLIRCAGDTVLSVPKVKQQDRAMLDAKDWWSGWKSYCGKDWQGFVVFHRTPSQ